MATGVTGRAVDPRTALGERLLGQAGQCVEFRQHTDDGLSPAEAGLEGRGHPRDAGFHAKAGGRELLLQQIRAAFFLVAELRVLPDLVRHVGCTLAVGRDLRAHRGFGSVPVGLGCARGRRDEEEDGGRTGDASRDSLRRAKAERSLLHLVFSLFERGSTDFARVFGRPAARLRDA